LAHEGARRAEWHPISSLPLIARAIDGRAVAAREQYETLLEARPNRPSADTTISDQACVRLGEGTESRPTTWKDPTMAAEHLGPWAPLSPEDAGVVFSACEARWWVAGGWAIDLLVGRQTRSHADFDVLVLRPEQHVVRSYLHAWDVHAADPPGTLRPWPIGEILPLSVHDIWCRRDPSAPWAFQLMIDDVHGEDWLFRRDHRIRRPVRTLAGRASRPGLAVLSCRGATPLQERVCAREGCRRLRRRTSRAVGGRAPLATRCTPCDASGPRLDRAPGRGPACGYAGAAAAANSSGWDAMPKRPRWASDASGTAAR
jgi:hypothetical protein